MKKLIILIGLFVASTQSFAQCKFALDSVDTFTGKKNDKAMLVYLTGGVLSGGEMLTITKTDSVNYLGYVSLAFVSSWSSKPFDYSQSSIMLKFLDNSILNLPNIQANDVSTQTGDRGMSMMGVNCKLSNEQLLFLSKNPIIKARVVYNQKTLLGLDLKITEKAKRKIQEAANCLL
ncbi:MAG: hypothetical protein H7296_07520 [Bacteroidia bacterium]|nr:hypothetical protein [Bacteroidia bacterium]